MAVDKKKLQALVAENKKPPFSATPRGKRPFPPKKKNPPPPPAEEDDAGEEDEGEGIDVEAIAKQIEDGDGDEDLLELTDGYDPEEDGNPPQWVEDEDTWEKAKEAVDPEGEDADYDEPWAVVAHVYQRMGGKVKSKKDK